MNGFNWFMLGFNALLCIAAANVIRTAGKGPAKRSRAIPRGTDAPKRPGRPRKAKEGPKEATKEPATPLPLD